MNSIHFAMDTSEFPIAILLLNLQNFFLLCFPCLFKVENAKNNFLVSQKKKNAVISQKKGGKNL